MQVVVAPVSIRAVTAIGTYGVSCPVAASAETGKIATAQNSCDPLCCPQMHGIRVESKVYWDVRHSLNGKQIVLEQLLSNGLGIQHGIIEANYFAVSHQSILISVLLKESRQVLLEEFKVSFDFLLFGTHRVHFDHPVNAATLAISDRSFLDNFFARAFAPAFPLRTLPLGLASFSSISPVAIRMT
jgi:hypothetical protein